MITQLIPKAELKPAICKKPGMTLTFKNISPLIQKALQELTEGYQEDQLADLIGDEDPTLLYYYLEELRKNNFLYYRTPFLDLFPVNEDFKLQSFVDVPFQLSRFTLYRFDGQKMVLENPLGLAKGFLTERGVQLLHILAKQTTLKELSEKYAEIPVREIEDTLALLTAAQMVTTSAEAPACAHWEFHDLLFHSKSRLGRIDVPFGGTFRFRDIFPSTPSIKRCSNSPIIPLMKPRDELQLTLEQTIEKRRSIREHGITPINLEQLGAFLWRTARVKSQRGDVNDETTTRPYPGGGARYELEIYPVINQCDGIEKGLYHYHPLEHQLCQVTPFNSEVEALLVDAQRSSGKQEAPQVLLIIAARFQRVSWKYQSMAYAVILKNLGVLLQTMYLVATASDLAPCAIGGGNSDHFCKVARTNYLEETSVGEFMLGSLPTKP